ncbi:hypothetical protein [Tessaracoccus coleopterorum]|uniref:hypothetical protein n=1 Tax=Tessaracoccus coleopterorum TaxID=2714950 RepID=UPI0018D4D653|nr:hypothetical protein [Tessaracoccus coleopterorum]
MLAPGLVEVGQWQSAEPGGSEVRVVARASVLPAALAPVPVATGAGASVVGIASILVLWLLVWIGWSAVEAPVGRITRRNTERSDLPVVSQHLAKLRAREGSWWPAVRARPCSYSQPDEHVAAPVRNIVHHSEHALHPDTPHHRTGG